MRMGTFDDNRRTHAERVGEFRRIRFTLEPPDRDLGLRRRLERFPFVPSDPARLEQDCYEAYNIQVAGLSRRLAAIGDPKPVIGVSGGLDSTHALIVAAQAMDHAGRPRSDILAFMLPGFATSAGTKSHAHARRGPQTLIRWVIASRQFDDEVSATLRAILDTAISPELVPGDELQSSESNVGPYALQDLHARSCPALRLAALEDRLPGMARTGEMGPPATGRPASRRPIAQPTKQGDPPLAPDLLPALLRLRPVQALGTSKRPQGLRRRLALAARRLARPLRRLGRRLAVRSRPLGRRHLERPPEPTIKNNLVIDVREPGNRRHMATTKQREAAKRNVKKAQAGARSKLTLKHLSAETRSALGKEANAVRRGDSPTRKELEQEARRLDIKGRSKMGKDELKRAVARAR